MARSTLALQILVATVFGMLTALAAIAQASVTVKLVLNEKGVLEEEDKKPGPSWRILDSSGSTATELKAAITSRADSKDLTMETHVVKLNPAITCTTFELIGSNLEKEGTLTLGSKIRFTGCEVYAKSPLEKPLGCHIHTAGKPAGTIESNELKGELVLHEKDTEPLIRIKPSGSTLATLLTSECTVPEVMAITGILYFKDCEGRIEVHQVKHLIEENFRTSMSVGADTVEHLETNFVGSAWLELSGAHSGLAWAAKP